MKLNNTDKKSNSTLVPIWNLLLRSLLSPEAEKVRKLVKLRKRRTNKKTKNWSKLKGKMKKECKIKTEKKYRLATITMKKQTIVILIIIMYKTI